MAGVFLYGPLAFFAVLDVVLPGQSRETTAVAKGHVIEASETAFGATLSVAPKGFAGGLFLALDKAAFARLEHYAQSLGLGAQPLTVWTDQGAQPCLTFVPTDPARRSDWDRDWDGEQWEAQDSALCVATAAEIMAAFGQISAARLHRRLEPIRVRASSRLRAQALAAPQQVRRAPGLVTVDQTRIPYAHFFAVEEYDLAFARFDGPMSQTVTRAAFVSGDAVTVLPYDPFRDRVLLVEQFRAGPFARGDGNPWQLEAIAGRIDPGETPEDCARREAEEEAGLTLTTLLPVAGYYPSPGAKTEFLYSYIAVTDLPDDAAGVFGVAEEAEDIRGHLVSFDAAMALVASGEVQNAPLILSLLWLQRERAGLRAGTPV